MLHADIDEIIDGTEKPMPLPFDCPVCGHKRNMPMTNADRMRAMTDEELLEFAKRQMRAWFDFPCGVVCENNCDALIAEECYTKIMSWLKKPAKE